MNSALIEKFFRKECTPHEAMQVALYLKANPQVLEQYMSIEEWEATGKELMPEDFWNEVWANIQKINKQRSVRVAIKRTVAVAASLIIIASAIYYFYASVKTTHQPVITAQLHPKSKRKSVTNTSNKILYIVLEDNSVIKLSPASTVQYDVPFAANKRDISLDGEAEFHVTKNKNKPFTVYAGSFATTALGTIFSVKKIADKNIINVKLFKGKVVIHATDNIKGWKDDIYLLAGEQMKFNAQTSLITVDKINNTNNTLANNIIKAKKIGEDSSSNQLTFSNALLSEVMQKLSTVYKTKIEYDSVVLDSMRFTGTISKNDSLQVILKVISQMNNLDVIQTNNEFTLSKNQ